MYFCLTGEPPLSYHDGPVANATTSGVVHSRAIQKIPGRLGHIIARMVSVDPAQRYASCTDAWNALKSVSV